MSDGLVVADPRWFKVAACAQEVAREMNQMSAGMVCL